MTLLEVEGLTSGYSKLPVLHGVDLSVGEREVVALIGSNGAGKSTLLKTIFQLLRPTNGSVRYDGADLIGTGTEKLVKRGMGYVPQGGNTFPGLTVDENLRVAASVLPAKRTSSAISTAYDRFPALAGRRSQVASTLSGGERQMLALAGAMATEPRFLALDEPTTGLAPTIVQELAHKISESRQTGAGILWVVEENPMDILPHCDRVYVMQGGRIAHHAPATEMLASDSLRALFLGLDHGVAPAGS